MLAAMAVILLDPQAARANPSVPVTPSESLTQRGEAGVTEADRNFVIRVRLMGRFPELSAADLTEADRDFMIRVRLAGLGLEFGETN
jgi:hypothetical protein